MLNEHLNKNRFDFIKPWSSLVWYNQTEHALSMCILWSLWCQWDRTLAALLRGRWFEFFLDVRFTKGTDEWNLEGSCPYDSVTRLVDFWNLLATHFLTKVAQICYCFLGNLQKCHLLSNTLSGYFWATSGKFGLLSFQNLVTLPYDSFCKQGGRLYFSFYHFWRKVWGLGLMLSTSIFDSEQNGTGRGRDRNTKKKQIHWERRMDRLDQAFSR